MRHTVFVLLGLAGACARVLGFQAGELEDESEAAGATGFSEPGPADAAGQGGSGTLAAAAGASDELGGASPGRCGDQRLDPPEECDGDQLGGATCTTAGDLAGGALGCDSECRYDFRACHSVQALALSAHACAVLDRGKLKCWGQNTYGQLGLGDPYPRGEEVNEMGANLPFVPLGEARVTQVTVGVQHTCVLTADNQVRCWGDNSGAQLGIPNIELLTSAAEAPTLDLGPGTVERIEAAGWHTCALFASGKVKCWGSNSYGQLGLGDSEDRGKRAGELGEQLPFIDLGEVPVEHLSGGAYHTCALGPWGAKCWGATAYAAVVPQDLLALGDQPFEMGQNLPLIELALGEVRLVTSGALHNCAQNAAGTVKCWGDNSFGQLGYGNRESYTDVTRLAGELPEVNLGGNALSLSAGHVHTCALLTDNRLKCWGSNDSGQLGLGEPEDRGGNPDDMGKLLPAVDLGTGHTIRGIAVGEKTSCAILNRGRLKCWGDNHLGILGLGHQRSVGAQAGEMGDALPFIEL